jgi:hydrogenase nickel incorporation protein HypA/HybF
MHGLSIANNLVKTVLKSLKSYDVKRVLGIEVEVGELMGISPEELRQGFYIAAEGTLLEGVSLSIQVKPAKIKCLKCGYKGASKNPLTHALMPSPQCPECGDFRVEILEGKGLRVKNLGVELK